MATKLRFPHADRPEVLYLAGAAAAWVVLAGVFICLMIAKM